MISSIAIAGKITLPAINLFPWVTYFSAMIHTIKLAFNTHTKEIFKKKNQEIKYLLDCKLLFLFSLSFIRSGIGFFLNIKLLTYAVNGKFIL